jgi:hypothetical protein
MICVASVCPLCGEGSRGFRLCSDQRTLVVMCDECDAIWLDIRRLEAEQAVYPSAPTFKLPNRDCSVMAPQSRWATRAEVTAHGWQDHIAKEGPSLDEA